MFFSLVLGLNLALINFWPETIRTNFDKYFFNINNSFNNRFVLTNRKKTNL
jgi:hypothetical protein